MSEKSRHLAITIVSAVFWLGWLFLGHRAHDTADLSNGNFSDHYSHMNAARVFPRIGTDIWRHSFRSLFPKLTDNQKKVLPDDLKKLNTNDIYYVAGWPSNKPLVASWSHNPRLYPPGDMLVAAPIAALYHFTPSFTFSSAALAMIACFIIYVHFGLYWIWRLNAVRENTLELPSLVALLVVYFEMIHWTLEGFYDAIAVAPLVVCAHLLARRQGLSAILAFCLAAFLHYRALYFAPLALWGLWLAIRQKELQFNRLVMVKVGCSALLSALALYPLSLLLPTLRTLPINNQASLIAPRIHPGHALAVIFAAIFAAIGCARAKSWVDVSISLWFLVMLVTLREAYVWHATILLAWLCFPAFTQKKNAGRWVFEARVILLLVASNIVFRGHLMPTWLRALV